MASKSSLQHSLGEAFNYTPRRRGWRGKQYQAQTTQRNLCLEKPPTLKQAIQTFFKNCIHLFCFLLEGRELLCINAALNKALSSAGDDFVFSGIKRILIQISIKAI